MTVANLTHQFTATLVNAAKAKGIPLKLLIGDAPLAGRRWEGPDLLRMLRRVAELMQDEFYGLAPEPCPVGTGQLGIELLALSDTLGAGLARCCRLYALVNNSLGLTLSEQDGLATISFNLAAPELDPDHFLVKWNSIRFYKLCQVLIGDLIPLTRAEFPHSPSVPRSEYTEIFGENCSFNQPRAAFSFPRGFLLRRIISKPSDLERMHTVSRHDPILSSDPRRSWRKSLESAIATRLAEASTMPTLEELAEEFGVCSQTLRRRLKAEKVSYRKLKAETRRSIALDGFRDERLTVSQISLMAGFAETNGLVRAMKSWMGVTPSEFRKTASSHDDRRDETEVATSPHAL